MMVAKLIQAAAMRTASAPFSLGWASRQPNGNLMRTMHRADQKLLAVRVIVRTLTRLADAVGRRGWPTRLADAVGRRGWPTRFPGVVPDEPV